MKHRKRYWDIETSITIKKIKGQSIPLDTIIEIFKTMKKGHLWFPHLIITPAYLGFKIALSSGQISNARSLIKLAYTANLIAFGKYGSLHKYFLSLMNIIDVVPGKIFEDVFRYDSFVNSFY